MRKNSRWIFEYSSQEDNLVENSLEQAKVSKSTSQEERPQETSNPDGIDLLSEEVIIITSDDETQTTLSNQPKWDTDRFGEISSPIPDHFNITLSHLTKLKYNIYMENITDKGNKFVIFTKIPFTKPPVGNIH